MRIRRGAAARAVGTDATSRIAAVAEQGGESVSEVLREVADFRLAFETDLLIAAAAIDAGEARIASEVVDGERAELASFQERVLDRLADAAADDELSGRRAARAMAERRSRVRGLRAAALVGAVASLLGVVGGGFANRAVNSRTPSEQVTLAEAEQQLGVLARATMSGSIESIEAVAEELHATLEVLIAEQAQGDPDVALQIARILVEEQALLDQRPSTGAQVIARVTALAKRLGRIAPRSIRATIAPLIPRTDDRPKSRSTATSSPQPKPSPSATTSSPTPKPSPTSAKASPSSSSSSEPAPIGSVAP